jgi:hypothetical protein
MLLKNSIGLIIETTKPVWYSDIKRAYHGLTRDWIIHRFLKK